MYANLTGEEARAVGLADRHKLHRFAMSQGSIHRIQRHLPFGGAAATLPYKGIAYVEQKEKVS